MPTFVMRDGKLVPKDEAPPKGGVSIWSDLPAYKSPLGDGWIEGRAARREHFKRTNTRPVDPSEFKPVYRNPHFAAKRGLPLDQG